MDKNTENVILTKVKDALGITGTGQDNTIQVYIDGMKEYMKAAGVSSDVIEDKVSYGAIVSGVVDTWQYGSGEITLSPFTKERVIQLRNTNLEEES